MFTDSVIFIGLCGTYRAHQTIIMTFEDIKVIHNILLARGKHTTLTIPQKLETNTRPESGESLREVMASYNIGY